MLVLLEMLRSCKRDLHAIVYIMCMQLEMIVMFIKVQAATQEGKLLDLSVQWKEQPDQVHC